MSLDMQLPYSPYSTRPHHTEPSQYQRQRQLPPLQDIINPDSSVAFDRKPRFEDEWDCSSGYLESPASSTPTTAASPLNPTGQPMSHHQQTFDELSFCTTDTMLSANNAWATSAQYAATPSPYSVSTATTQPYYGRPVMSQGRSSQNLPSLTDMNLPNSSTAYSARPAPIGRTYQPSSYYGNTTSDPMEISYAKSTQTNYAPSYGLVTSNRTSYPVTPYGSDWSPISDAYCYPNGHSWPPSMQCATPGYVSSDTSGLSGTRRRRGNLPKQVTDILRGWFHEHLDHPYPTEEDKQMLISKTNLTMSQISNWFINARRRHWPQAKQNREQYNKVQARSHC